jgi:hypothetical protein
MEAAPSSSRGKATSCEGSRGLSHTKRLSWPLVSHERAADALVSWTRARGGRNPVCCKAAYGHPRDGFNRSHELASVFALLCSGAGRPNVA